MPPFETSHAQHSGSGYFDLFTALYWVRWLVQHPPTLALPSLAYENCILRVNLIGGNDVFLLIVEVMHVFQMAP